MLSVSTFSRDEKRAGDGNGKQQPPPADHPADKSHRLEQAERCEEPHG